MRFLFFRFQDCCSLFGDLCAIVVRKFFLPIFCRRLSGWRFLLVVIIVFIGTRLSCAVLILFIICFIGKCTQNAIIMFCMLEITFCENRLAVGRSFWRDSNIFRELYEHSPEFEYLVHYCQMYGSVLVFQNADFRPCLDFVLSANLVSSLSFSIFIKVGGAKASRLV